MSDRRVLGFAWLVATVCLWFVLADLLRWGLGYFNVANAEYFGGGLTTSSILAIGVSLVAAVVCWKAPKIFAFCIETVQETRKVVWPTQQETRDHTVVVVITSIAIALMLWGFDQVFKRLFGVILNMGA